MAEYMDRCIDRLVERDPVSSGPCLSRDRSGAEKPQRRNVLQHPLYPFQIQPAVLRHFNLPGSIPPKR